MYLLKDKTLQILIKNFQLYRCLNFYKEEKPICKKIKYAIFFNNRMYIAKLSHAHLSTFRKDPSTFLTYFVDRSESYLSISENSLLTFLKVLCRPFCKFFVDLTESLFYLSESSLLTFRKVLVNLSDIFCRPF